MIRLLALALAVLLAGCSANEAPAPTAPSDDAPQFRRLSSSPEAEVAPRFSPDGAQLVYERAGGLRVMDVATRTSRVLVPQGNHPSWTSDGSAVVFVRRDIAPAGLIHRLMRVALATGALDTLSADSVDAYEPAASPTSAAIVLRQLSRVSRRQTLRVVDASGATLEVLAEAGPYVDSTPAWSRDGASIAFVRVEASGAGRLMVVPANGSAAASMLRAAGDLVADPAWMADGRVAYARAGTISWIAPGDASVHVLVEGDGFELAPALSNDGTRLAFTSDRTGNRELWMLDAPGGIGAGPYRY
jgi:Tol biopolymer transport system component